MESCFNCSGRNSRLLSICQDDHLKQQRRDSRNREERGVALDSGAGFPEVRNSSFKTDDVFISQLQRKGIMRCFLQFLEYLLPYRTIKRFSNFIKKYLYKLQYFFSFLICPILQNDQKYNKNDNCDSWVRNHALFQIMNLVNRYISLHHYLCFTRPHILLVQVCHAYNVNRLSRFVFCLTPKYLALML